jgi:hypothetical protein
MFSKKKDYIFYHFNPVENRVKNQMMNEFMAGHVARSGAKVSDR